MDLTKEVFTTSEAARLCHANISSIKNWIEQGRLKAFRTPGGHYRIERQSLGHFLDRHNMPNPLSASASLKRVLILGHSAAEAEPIKRAFSHAHDVVVITEDILGLMTFGQWRPDYVVASKTDTIDLDALCTHAKVVHPDCVLVCLGEGKHGHQSFPEETPPDVIARWIAQHGA